MILAYVEVFLATAFEGIYPHSQEMRFSVSKVSSGAYIQVSKDSNGNRLSINTKVSDKENVSYNTNTKLYIYKKV